MTSGDDFQQTIDAQTEKRREVDHRDHQNEVAGRSTGRMYRFHPAEKPDGSLSESKHKHDHTALHLLLRDPEYAKLYNDTLDLLSRAEAATEKVLTQAELDFSQEQDQLKVIRDQASKLPDGTAVFLDTEDKAWTEDDRLVDEQKTQSIVWKDNAPTREEYLQQKQKIENTKQRIEELRHYQIDVLGHARDRITDEDTPPSKEEMEEIRQNILDHMPEQVAVSIEAHAKPEHTPPVENMAQSFSIPVLD